MKKCGRLPHGRKRMLRYAKEGETKVMMVLADGTKFEVPIERTDDGERS